MRGRPSPELSVCSLVHAPPGRVAATLAPLRELGPEVVLGVDDRVDPDWIEEYRRLADRVILAPFPGSFSPVFSWLREQCAGTWILHVEDDEVPGTELAAEVAETVERADVTHAWVRRRWLYPDRRRYLDQWPWLPDYSLRLFRNDPALLRFPGRVHELVSAVGPRRFLRAPVYHGRLLLGSLEERERKAAHYEQARPGLILEGRPLNETFYLPERRRGLRTAPVPKKDAELVDRFVAKAGGLPAAKGRCEVERAEPAEVTRAWERRELGPGACRARLRLLDDDLHVTAGETRTFDVEVENLGDERWPGGLDAHPQIRVAYRWLEGGEEGLRTGFGAPVGPGERVLVPVEVLGPPTPGKHMLELDLVHEHVRWFGAGIRVTLTVESPATDGQGTMGACSAPRSTTSSRN